MAAQVAEPRQFAVRPVQEGARRSRGRRPTRCRRGLPSRQARAGRQSGEQPQRGDVVRPNRRCRSSAAPAAGQSRWVQVAPLMTARPGTARAVKRGARRSMPLPGGSAGRPSTTSRSRLISDSAMATSGGRPNNPQITISRPPARRARPAPRIPPPSAPGRGFRSPARGDADVMPQHMQGQADLHPAQQPGYCMPSAPPSTRRGLR